MNRIQCKFKEEVFVPHNAIEGGFSNMEKVTLDGVKVKLEVISTTNNQGGYYMDWFDYTCRRLYDTPFTTIRSIFVERLGSLDDCWHIIKLKRI